MGVTGEGEQRRVVELHEKDDLLVGRFGGPEVVAGRVLSEGDTIAFSGASATPRCPRQLGLAVMSYSTNNKGKGKVLVLGAFGRDSGMALAPAS